MLANIITQIKNKFIFYLLLTSILSFNYWFFILLQKKTRQIYISSFIYILEDLNQGTKPLDLMLGSSSIYRMQASKYLLCGNWLNRGIGSALISDIIRYIQLSPLSIRPSKIIIYAGENDITNGISVSNTINLYGQLIDKLMKKYPQSNIHILAIKPSPKHKFYHHAYYKVNSALKSLADKFDSIYFHNAQWYTSLEDDKKYFLNDKIHLTMDGYIAFSYKFNLTCKI